MTYEKRNYTKRVKSLQTRTPIALHFRKFYTLRSCGPIILWNISFLIQAMHHAGGRIFHSTDILRIYDFQNSSLLHAKLAENVAENALQRYCDIVNHYNCNRLGT